MLGSAALALGVFAWLGPRQLPDAIATVSGWRVARGQLPYRDFWTLYAPGSSLLLGALFRIFGEHAMVSLAGASVLCAAAVGVLVRLARALGAPAGQALAAGGLLMASLVATGYFRSLGSYPPALLALLLALLAAVRGTAPGGRAARVAAGLAAGTAAVFKHDVGAYTALAAGAGVAAAALADPTRRGRLGAWLLPPVEVGLGALAVVLPTAAVVAAVGGARAWSSLVVFPATAFPATRPEVYPGLVPTWIFDPWWAHTVVNLTHWFTAWMPLGVLAVALVAARRRLGATGAQGIGPAAAFAVGLGLHFAAAHVQINTHAVTLTVYGVLLGLWLRPRAALATLVAAGWLGALAAGPVFKAWDTRLQETTWTALPRISGFRLPADREAALEALVPWVQARTAPDERVFVGLDRHDSIIVSDPGVSFVLDRLPATRYHELHPGIADTERVQRQIVRELERRHVSLAVRVHIFGDDVLDAWKAELGARLPDTGAGTLDAWLARRFTPVERFGPFEVWQRKGEQR